MPEELAASHPANMLMQVAPAPRGRLPIEGAGLSHLPLLPQEWAAQGCSAGAHARPQTAIAWRCWQACLLQAAWMLVSWSQASFPLCWPAVAEAQLCS